ncbi:MAG: GNAT family N-acetyltransferase [Ancalomicrobiaceae bacterium]|nr:GNAT family N-acetyltransferase [Ancalomicrobiaceae bacterium]
MTSIAWEEAPIGRQHDRAAFDCGDANLDLYVQKFARQNHECGGAKCFVASPVGAPARILGFYTLGPASLDYARTPALAKKGLARYDVPAFRLGRLAVDVPVQGRGFGGALLLRAADRCLRVAQDVGGVALLIDAKSDRIAQWYESYGALRLEDAPLSLVLPLAVAADALRRGR